MIIATYHTENTEVAPNRRWIAQIEKIAGKFFVTFHGETEQEAHDRAAEFIAKIPVKKAGEEVAAEPIPVLDAVPSKARRRSAEADVL